MFHAESDCRQEVYGHDKECEIFQFGTLPAIYAAQHERELAAAGAANDRVVVRDAIASMREQSQSAKQELPVGKQG